MEWTAPRGSVARSRGSNTDSTSPGNQPQHLSEASRAHLAQHPGSRLLGKSSGIRKVWGQAWKSVLRSVLGPVMVTKFSLIPEVARQAHCDEAHLKSSEEVRPRICRQIKLATPLQTYNPVSQREETTTLKLANGIQQKWNYTSFPATIQSLPQIISLCWLLVSSTVELTGFHKSMWVSPYLSLSSTLQQENQSFREKILKQSSVNVLVLNDLWSQHSARLIGLWNAPVWDVIVNHNLWAVPEMTSDQWKLLFSFFFLFFFP